MRETLERDAIRTPGEALMDIYRKLRPGEPPTAESAAGLLQGMYFNPKRYDLAKVGRYKVNAKLGLNLADKITIMTKEDLYAAVRYLLALHEGDPDHDTDDIDHFGNRRVRSSASSSPTRSASAWPVWSASSKSACRHRTPKR